MAQVTLLQGSVAVSLGESEEVLSPNQQAFIDHSSKVISVREVNNATSAAAWTHGWFDFEAATLTEIVSTLEKWYDVDISAPSIDLYSYGIFSMRMNCAGNIESILKMLNEVTGLRYKTDGNTILLIQ
jgi:ferric-dicitrate binding protein FerR (iron transport regulator)